MRLPNVVKMPTYGQFLASLASYAAAGSGQSTGTALKTQTCVVTAADGTKGVVLPTAKIGMTILVINTVADSALKVYPATGAAINALSANAAFTVGGGQVAKFVATAALQWYVAAATGGILDDLTIGGDVTITAGGQIKSSVSNTVYPVVLNQVQQAINANGAITLTQYFTALTSVTTTGVAFTLADSTVIGQVKKIQLVADGGSDAVVTFNTNATVTFADVGDVAELIWNGADWIPIALYNVASGDVGPAYVAAS